MVEKIEVEEYSGAVRDIESFRSSFNSAQLAKIANTGLTMLEKQDQTIEEIRVLGKKQDKTVDEIKALRFDLKSYMEDRFAKIEHEIAENTKKPADALIAML